MWQLIYTYEDGSFIDLSNIIDPSYEGLILKLGKSEADKFVVRSATNVWIT